MDQAQFSVEKAASIGTKITSGWMILKAIFSTFVFLIIALIMVLAKVPWYIILPFVLFFILINVLYIRRQVKIMRGEITPKNRIILGQKGKPIEVKQTFNN